MHQQPPLPSTPYRRWTPAEDTLLYHLRIIEQRPWPEIAEVLDRTPYAVSAHYQQLKLASAASFEDWDTSMDAQVIDGRGRGLTSREIGMEMGVPAEAVQGRWYELQQLKKVPEEVLLVWRKKGEVVWTEEEDEEILRAWIGGMNEANIVRCLEFEGKYMVDVRERYRLLLREKGPVYRRLMGLDEKRPAPHALDRALGKKKFAWMT